MLQKLTEELAECYTYASECRERAKRTLDPVTKEDLLGMERRWLSLAHSYEFAEQLSELPPKASSGVSEPRHALRQ
jgi:hypothetical protein